ncbi:hypothetical protein Cgig2_032575 [Carnegiea gigantea]|uniref:Reverse transcriptase zinc-binding domain-containing protein n=1 Tax=Carnegiea gigantea TaxID=171969 RepID=A0A9Q1KW32_9CARY|nr:hypothetical protein Cgig2_032575 [Carnegiea gigantea]
MWGMKLGSWRRYLRCKGMLSRHKTLGRIREWWQRAQTNHLKYGDSNTCWFHSRASMRCLSNSIEQLMGKDGVMHSAPEEIDNVVVITPKLELASSLKVSDFIDGNQGCWGKKELFLPCDVDTILGIPLCNSWPADKLIWDYKSNGLFTVRSAYHLIMKGKRDDVGCSFMDDNKFWKALWELDILPRVKIFAWRVCRDVLPTRCNLARRMAAVGMNCAIYGAMEESDIHILLECPFAQLVRRVG